MQLVNQIKTLPIGDWSTTNLFQESHKLQQAV
jgi:hypothetical protein